MLFIAMLLVFQSYRIGTWRFNRSIIHDITSYYSYLPAAFIYHDFQFNYRYTLPENEPVDHVWVNTRGDTVFQKMSIGLSYFYAPTFLIAHYYTVNFSEYNANGFSKPYQMALNINTLFFGIAGVVVVWLLCSLLFTDLISALILLILYGGTNLLYYISGAPGLSHPYSFLLIVLVYTLTILFFRSPNNKILFILSVLVGLIVLIRPTNIILCLFPLIYGMQTENRRILLEWLKSPKTFLLIILGAILFWIPQFIYWKYATGHFIFYSYDQEGFFFNKPHVVDGLLSYRKGWLVYSPIFAFAILGLFVNRSFSSLKKPLFYIFPLFIYVVFSWWCWWYGGSFGSRVMIDIYPLLIVGFAAMLQWLHNQKWWINTPIYLSLLFCIYLNFNQTAQYSIGMLHWDSMTKEAYWSIFLQNTPPDHFQDLIKHPDYKAAMEHGE